MKQIFPFIFLMVSLFACTSEVREKNPVELELDEIEEGVRLEDLMKIEFIHFTVDWDDPNQWESSCKRYDVKPRVDTLKRNYVLDFCYDKYRWWDGSKKKEGI